MARINLDELRADEKVRNTKYVWEKPLVFEGRIIKASKLNDKKEKQDD